MRPSWTVAGATVSAGVEELTLDQTPFRWIDGIWEADVDVRHALNGNAPWHQLAIRISPDTVRRWNEVGINPFIEACAQIREHLGGVRAAGLTSFLTLL